MTPQPRCAEVRPWRWTQATAQHSQSSVSLKARALAALLRQKLWFEVRPSSLLGPSKTVEGISSQPPALPQWSVSPVAKALSAPLNRAVWFKLSIAVLGSMFNMSEGVFDPVCVRVRFLAHFIVLTCSRLKCLDTAVAKQGEVYCHS